MCEKQSSVSHISTESEIISLDAGLRMYGLLALDLWDMEIEVLRSTSNNVQPSHASHQETGAVLDSKANTQKVKRRQKVDQLSDVDYVPTNTHSCHNESQLHIFEDNEAVINMIITERSLLEYVISTDIDRISSNTMHSGAGAMLHVFEYSEAVIKRIIKGRSPTMRHVSRTHRVALDWLFDRINLDPRSKSNLLNSQTF